MWTLDENPNCETTHASVRLTGDEVVPDVVERVTGLAGDFAAAKGELGHPRSGREIRQRTGVWLISSDGQVASTSLERHILFLLEKLEPAKGKLLAVAHEQGATADFYCYWVAASDQGGLGLSPATLGRMSELQGILAFDFYSAVGED